MEARVDALISDAAAIREVEEQRKALLHAAQLCLDSSAATTDLTVRANLRKKAAKLLDQVEHLTQASTGQPSGTSGVFDLRSIANAVPGIASNRSTEPVSNRTLSKSEQKLILLASRFNGEKFVPWTRAPTSRDFSLTSQAETFRDSPDMRLSRCQIKSFDGWQPAKGALPPPSWIGTLESAVPTMIPTKPIDLVQDLGSDCSVVASFCADQARAERGHGSVLSRIIHPFDTTTGNPTISPNGKYMFKFNFNGAYRCVQVDDRLPISKTKRVLHVVDRNNPSLLWPALLEKAYLKVRGGYAFPGSNSNTDLWIMAGWLPEQVFLQETDPVSLWRTMFKAFQDGDILVTMGTGQMSRQAEKVLGLAAQHDYAVIDLKEENNREMVLLKNPWCEDELWTPTDQGPQADLDGHETSIPILESVTEISLANDFDALTSSSQTPQPLGAFWISVHDIFQHFESVYMNWNPSIFKFKSDLHFEWDLTMGPSGSNFINNPQFSLHSKKGGVIWLVLSRHFRDSIIAPTSKMNDVPDHTSESATHSSSENKSPPRAEDDEVIGFGQTGHISLYLFDNRGERVYINRGALEHSPYVDSPQSLLKIDMKSQSTYTVVVSEQHLESAKHGFTLSAYSVLPCEMAEASSKYAHTVSIESSWTPWNSGGSVLSPTFSTNPQFLLQLLQPSSIAILLEAKNPELKINAKLCHGNGRRIHALKRQDIVLESSEYQSGSDFAERWPHVLEVGTYTIIPSTFDAGVLGQFSMRIDTNSRATLTALPSEHAGKFVDTLPRAVFSGTTTALAVRLYPQCMLKINVIVRFVRSSFPHNSSTSLRTKSPIQVRVCIGQGPEERVLSSSGEFSNESEAGIRLPEVNLSPDMSDPYRPGLFLVLERLGSGVVGSEERYWVEMLHEGGVGGGLKWTHWEGFD